MSLTRAQLLAHVEAIFGDTSTNIDTHLQTALNNGLYYLWDAHDWNFKHKSSSFATVAGTESYTLSTGTTDLRSSQDIEVMYDSTNGLVLPKVDLKNIRKQYPKHDSSGKPTRYAPWGSKTVFLDPKPDDAYTIKFLYLAKPTLPTQSTDDLETVCGLPDYIQPLLEEIVIGHAMRYIDDNRYGQQQELIERVLLPRAIQADMKHLESGARIKFWEEETRNQFNTYGDFLNFLYSGSYGRY